MTHSEIIDRALSLVGRPFQDRGRTEHGIDCYGIVLFVFGLVGSPCDQRDYRADVLADGEMADVLLRGGFERRDSVDDAQSGDVLTFRWWGRQDRVERHIAVLADSWVVHTNEIIGRVVKSTYQASHKRLAVGAYRFSGLEEAA